MAWLKNTVCRIVKAFCKIWILKELDLDRMSKNKNPGRHRGMKEIVHMIIFKDTTFCEKIKVCRLGVCVNDI